MQHNLATHRAVWIKLDFIKDAFHSKIEAIDSQGIWFRASELTNDVARNSLQKKELQGAVSFVPLSRVQFVLALADSADSANAK